MTHNPDGPEVSAAGGSGNGPEEPAPLASGRAGSTTPAAALVARDASGTGTKPFSLPVPGAWWIDRRCNHGTCTGKPHYVVMGRCANCEWEGYVWITLGHEKRDRCEQAECPRCGCRTIQPGEHVDV